MEEKDEIEQEGDTIDQNFSTSQDIKNIMQDIIFGEITFTPPTPVADSIPSAMNICMLSFTFIILTFLLSKEITFSY